MKPAGSSEVPWTPMEQIETQLEKNWPAFAVKTFFFSKERFSNGRRATDSTPSGWPSMTWCGKIFTSQSSATKAWPPLTVFFFK